MSSINVLNIIVHNPVDSFINPFKFEIVFECLSELKEDIDWKLIYIGSAEDISFDQELESVAIGPLQIGSMKFELEAPCPDASKIPSSEILGVTALLLTCSYKDQEFFRCGYYVNNFYENEEWNTTPPEQLHLDKLKRHILFDKPRITKFNISWDQPKAQISSNYNNFMFDENFHNNNIQNEFKNVDYNNFNNNLKPYPNPFINNNNQEEKDSDKIFQDLLNKNQKINGAK